MGLETGDYIDDLIADNPDGGVDAKNQGDDHLRLIKKVLLQSFPAIDGGVSATPAELNLLSGRTAIGLIGQIAMWISPVIPDGWLLCDGSPIDPAHTGLIGLIGANVPDMRGYFPRGLDPLGAVDPDGASRTLGDTQVDEFKSHQHTIYNGDGLNSTVTNGGVVGAARTVEVINTTNATGGAETRPVNIAVNFIIQHD